MAQATESITVRRPRVVWTEQTDWQLAHGEPELSAIAVALSLLMPHLEPYLLRSMQQASQHIRLHQEAPDAVNRLLLDWSFTRSRRPLRNPA